MKSLMVIVCVGVISVASAAGFHRSFRNGYPAEAQLTRETPNSAKLSAPKLAKRKVKVITNVVIRCGAKTKSGSWCTRKAAPGEKLCRQHLLIEQKKAAKRNNLSDFEGQIPRDRPRQLPAD